VKKMKFFRYTSILFVIGLFVTGYGQQATLLTFEESLKLALKQSNSIKRARVNLLARAKDVEAARAGLKSYAFFEADLPEFDQSISQEFNSATYTYDFFRTQQLRYESRITITQPLPTNGKLSVNGSFFKLIQTGGVEDYSSNVFLKFSQPIFTYNRIKLEIRYAELQLEMQKIEFIRDCLEIIEDVTEEFYELFEKSLEVKIIREEFFQRESSFKSGIERDQNNEIDEIDLIQLEVDLAMARDELLQNETELKNREDEFKQTIGFGQEENIEIATNLDFIAVGIELEKAINEGIKNRIDIKRNDLNEEIIRMWIQDNKGRREFKGEITATYGLNKADERLRGAFREFDKTRSVMINFYVPLWDWGRNKARVAEAEFGLEKHHLWMKQNLKMIKVQIMNSFSETIEAIGGMKVLEKSRELATKSYELTREKYNRNLVNSETLNLAQKRLTDARMAYIGAFIKYKNAIADLKINSTWDFEKNRSLIQDIYKSLNDLEKNGI